MIDPRVKKATGRSRKRRAGRRRGSDGCATAQGYKGYSLTARACGFVSAVLRCIRVVNQGCVFGAVYGSVGSEPLGPPNGEYESVEGIPGVLLPLLLRVGAHSSDAAPMVLRFTGGGEMIFWMSPTR